ncbi:MAG: IS110 family transposase [Thaumarchaeota archaeon]|nr:IS110 family transposase [Nitrososphaerota archaeon]
MKQNNQKSGVTKLRREIAPDNADMTNPTVAGVDLGESSSLASVLSPSGDIVDTFTFKMGSEGYQMLADRLPEGTKIACEAMGVVYPFYRTMHEKYGFDVAVANVKELAWITKSKKKSDKIDSLKLARLHMVGMLPESHLLTREEQLARDLLIQRVKLGEDIRKVKLRILSYLKREGVNENLPKMSDNFSSTRRHLMRALSFGDERDLIMKTMLDRLEFLEGQCVPFEAAIKVRAKVSDDVKILMSVKGIDFYLASLLSSYIGDVNRFPSDNQLASAFGIVPVERQSSSVKKIGRMSREGPGVARWALSVAADCVRQQNEQIKAYYEVAKKRTGRTKKARIVTMRKLLRMLYFMLKTRQNWKWENPESTTEKISRLDSKARRWVPSSGQ